MVANLSGNTPTDMPLSRSTSNVLTMSSQPSAWVRLPASTSRLRNVSTRRMPVGGMRGLRMAAISGAPMYLSGTITVPLPGGSVPWLASRGAATMPVSVSGLPT